MILSIYLLKVIFSVMQEVYYKILGISRESTAEEIKIAFRGLAKKYHPDSNGGNENFTEIMQDINESYSILNNRTKREKYNKDYDFTFGKFQYKKDEPKKEKPKQEQPKQKTQEHRDLNIYFWNGTNTKKYQNYLDASFEKFKQNVLKSLQKDEFEKTEQFELRRKVVESELFNEFLGVQNVDMVYDADKEIKWQKDVLEKIENSEPTLFESL